jgi:uncharacterized protein (TIGR02265 family)
MRPDGFVLPDWNAPLDVEAAMALAPAQVQVRGFVISGMLARLKAQGVTLDTPGFVPFRSYPYRQQMELLVKGAQALAPGNVRQGLRLVGRMAFPSVLETLPGRVVFGVLGKDVQAIFKVAAKGYEMVGAHARVTVPVVTASHAHLVLQDVHAFPEAYHVGVCEGAVLACGKTPQIWLKTNSPTHVELWCQYE